MSVTVTVDAILEAGRVYPELPVGIFPWTANAQAVGDGTGGQLNVNVVMHPGASRAFTLYVALAKAAVKTNVAANTARIELRILNDQEWEFDYSAIVPLDTLNPQPTTGTTVNKADEHQHLQYLGRTNPGFDGQINVSTANVDTMTMDIRLVGFYSDRPFIPHNDWRL